MADLETKVKVSADTTGLKQIGEESKKAFEANRVKALRQATRELQSDLKNLAKTQAQLTSELLKTEKGTKAYKDLSKELKTVAKETDAVRKATDDLNKSMETGRKQRQGFVAGLAQGAGVAQYIPTGPGMMPRMGGAMLGGMGRRIAGGAAAPFMQPGIGGFAAMLSAIPGIGPGLGGLVQQGAGYWQQAQAFSAARLQNLPYANLEARGQFVANPRFAQAEAAFMTAQQRIEDIESGVAIPTPVRLSQTAETRGRQRAQNALAAIKGLTAGAGTGAMGRAATRPAPSAELPEESAARRAYNRKYKTEMTKAENVAAAAAKRMAAESRGWRRDTSGIPSAGFGASLGFTPEATQQWFGQMMGARGGISSREYLQGTIREAMGVGRLFGVGAQTIGGWERMGMPGGGGTGGMSIAQAVATGTAQGLSGSQIPEYLQSMVEQGRRAEAQGIKIDPTAMTGGAMFMRAAGLKGPQAARVSAGLQQAGRGLAATGVQKPMDLLLLRAAGWSPGQGAEGMALAYEKLEGGMDPEMMESLISTVAEGAQAGGWGPSMTRRRFQHGMRRLGAPIGWQQARSILEGGPGERREAMEAVQAKAAKPGDYLAEARAGAGRIGGLAVVAAGRQAAEIRLGNKLAGTFNTLDAAGRTAVGTLAQFSGSMTSAANLVLDSFKKLDKVVEKMVAGEVGWWVDLIKGDGS